MLKLGCCLKGMFLNPNSITNAFSYGFSWKPCPTSFKTSIAAPTIWNTSSLNNRVFSFVLFVSIRGFIFLSRVAHDLIGDGLHQGLGIGVSIISDSFAGSHIVIDRAGDTGTPAFVVAKFAFLEAKAGIRNSEALFDFQEILKLGGGHGFG